MSANIDNGVRAERHEAVATVVLDRPDRHNAIDARMACTLATDLRGLAEDPTVRVVVLTGAGDTFCPGGDLRMLSGEEPPELMPNPRDAFSVPVLLHHLPFITIAAVNGGCAGAALGWAAACDLRYASDSALFNTAFLDLGVSGDMAGPWTLPKIVGAARARELYFLPAEFGAQEALRIGLVNGVFPDREFRDEVVAVARRIASADGTALAAMKANFLDAEHMGLADYSRVETKRILTQLTTPHIRQNFADAATRLHPRNDPTRDE